MSLLHNRVPFGMLNGVVVDNVVVVFAAVIVDINIIIIIIIIIRIFIISIMFLLFLKWRDNISTFITQDTEFSMALWNQQLTGLVLSTQKQYIWCG